MAAPKGKRGPNKVLTAAEVQAKIAAAKKQIAELEALAHSGTIADAIAKSKLVSQFNDVKAAAKGASDVAILAALGKAVGIKRLSVTQTEPVARKPRTAK
jgi:hypothetical protein